MTETTEGDVVFSICSYVAETDEAISLVEGERVYVLGKFILSNHSILSLLISICICSTVTIFRLSSQF